MAHDFYRRMHDLTEEFQKRELACLNIERKWLTEVNKSHQKVPEEYLRKIEERENHVKESFESIMRQMQNFDRHIASMSQKLEKLKYLKRVVDHQNWPSTSISHNLNSQVPITSHSFDAAAPPHLNMQTMSTQAENTPQGNSYDSISFLNKLPNSFPENLSTVLLPESSMSVQSNSQLNVLDFGAVSSLQTGVKSFSLLAPNFNELSHQTGVASVPLFDTTLNKGNQLSVASSLAQEVTKRQSDMTFVEPSLSNLNEATRLETSQQKQSSSVLPVAESPQKANNAIHETVSQVEVQLDENASKPTRNAQANASTPVKKVVEPAVLDIGTLSEVKRQDRGHDERFDFLESETPKEGEETQPPASPVRVISPAKVAPEKEHLQVTVQDESSSPSSVHGHSFDPENLLPGSDSDSLSGKEMPLQASAAYKAFLLGNNPLPASTQKISDSDSEDEVERALTKVVSKNSKVLTSAQAVTKTDEKSVPGTVIKSPVKKSQKDLSSKPQSKLARSTRKALGLDVSSESEEESTVAAVKKTNEDDEDEFFYD